MANVFLDTFLTVLDYDTTGEKLPRPHQRQHQSRMVLRPTDPMEVLHLLNYLAISFAAGEDDISTIIAKKCAEQICFPLCDVFHACFAQGVFTDVFKLGKMIPLFIYFIYYL